MQAILSSLGREGVSLLIISTAGLIAPFLALEVPLVNYLAIPLVTVVPGFCLMRLIAPKDILTRLVTAFPGTLVISSFYGLVLAIFGLFDQFTMSIGLFLISVTFLVFSRRWVQNGTRLSLQLTRKNTLVLLVAIAIVVISNLGLLVLFQYPVGYDAWSFMASSKLIASTGSIPKWLDGSPGQLNFYPPLFPIYMASILEASSAPVVSVFWISPIFLGAFFVMSIFAFARQGFQSVEVGLVSALLASTIGSARFEGVDRAFPLSLAMIAFPTFLLIWNYVNETPNNARVFAAEGCSAFLWLCFPPAGLLAVMVTFVDTLSRRRRLNTFFVWVEISITGFIPVLVYYLPYVISFGIPRNNFFAPWLASFQNASIFSISFLMNLFNYSGFLIPAGLVLCTYSIFRRVKFEASNRLAVCWTLVSVGTLLLWEIALQGRLQFLGSVRFIPFLVTGFAILTASLMSSVISRTKIDVKGRIPRQSVFAVALLCLIVASSAVVTTSANYGEWLPPSLFPVSSSYYQAAIWLRDHAPSGARVLTMDPLAQPLIEDVAGGTIHTTYDVTTYAFWVPPEVLKAYSDTVIMLVGNNATSVALIASYGVSFILITPSTVQYLSQIEGISQTQVEGILTSEFVNNTGFEWEYSDLSSYQNQAGVLWAGLQNSSTGSQLQGLWNQLPGWAKSVFQIWLEKSGDNFYQLSWDQVLTAIKSLATPNIASLASSLSLDVMPLPVIYRVVRP